MTERAASVSHLTETAMSFEALETVAFSHKFRSRLEARWAVFFENLSLKWEYEPQGFLIDDVSYLPDFRVFTPQGKEIWYEIKPLNVSKDHKFSSFASKIDEGYGRTVLVSGSPRDFFKRRWMCYRCGVFLHINAFSFGVNCDNEMSSQCDNCDWETPESDGHPYSNDGLLGCPYRPHKGLIVCKSFDRDRVDAAIERAIIVAMSQRFERGDSPKDIYT
jgi:hypothetical protein